MNSYTNPIQFNPASQTYMLQLPPDLVLFIDNGDIEIALVEILDDGSDIFDCISSYEDYSSAMEEYIKRHENTSKTTAKVLLLYYDEKRMLHATLAVRVSISRMESDIEIDDTSCIVSRNVKAFAEWLASYC